MVPTKVSFFYYKYSTSERGCGAADRDENSQDEIREVNAPTIVFKKLTLNKGQHLSA